MNDVQFIEAARKFAERVMIEGGVDDDSRLTFAFRMTTSRSPRPTEVESLTRLLHEYQAEFKNDPEAAAKLLSAGESPRDETLDASRAGRLDDDHTFAVESQRNRYQRLEESTT